MKKQTLVLSALAALALASSASAQTVINITGATAFRQAAHQAIIDSLGNLTYGYQSTNIGNAGRAIFKGDINSGADQVIVRTSWGGAVAGIRAIVNQADAVTYFSSTTGGLTLGGTPNLSPATESTTANSIAFADNSQDNTPFDAVALGGGPVGVVAFVPVVNETAQLTQGDNITTLQLRRMIQAGNAPLQFITGDALDAGIKIYWTGRQDTSGTRVIYLSEMGVGASAAAQQWRVEPLNTSASAAVTQIRLWPTGDATNQSIIWGADAAGNGGYASGGALAPVLQRTSSSGVTVLNASGGSIATNQEVVLLSVISAQEGEDIQVGGGKVLAYNGVYIEPETIANGGLNAADRAKIIKGDYTLWSYERLFYRDDLDQIGLDFVALLEAQVPLNIGGNGIALTDMRVTRPAATDGGSLTVLGSLL